MRCYSCDCELSDYESTLKSSNTGQYLDLCSHCLKETGISSTPFTIRDSSEKEQENEFQSW